MTNIFLLQQYCTSQCHQLYVLYKVICQTQECIIFVISLKCSFLNNKSSCSFIFHIKIISSTYVTDLHLNFRFFLVDAYNMSLIMCCACWVFYFQRKQELKKVITMNPWHFWNHIWSKNTKSAYSDQDSRFTDHFKWNPKINNLGSVEPLTVLILGIRKISVFLRPIVD